MLPRKARRSAEILLQGGRLMVGMTFGTPLEKAPCGDSSSPELAHSILGLLARIAMG